MKLPSMTTFLLLLWGTSVMFSTETRSVSIPETSSSHSSAEPNTSQVPRYETQHVMWDPSREPAEISVATSAESAASPTSEGQEATVSGRSDNSTAGLVVAANASSSGPGMTHMITQPSGNMMPSETEEPTEHQNSLATPTYTSAFAGAVTSAADVSSLQPTSVAELVVTSSSSDNFTQAPHVIQNLSGSSNSTPTTNPSSNLVDPTSAFQPGSDAGTHISTSQFPDATGSSSTAKAPHFLQDLSSPSASNTTTTTTASRTSKTAPVFDPTTLAVTVAERAATSTEVSSTLKPISDTRTHISTSRLPDATGLSSATESPTATDSANPSTTFFTSLSGIIIPQGSKRVPLATTKSTTKATNSPSTTEVQPCSTRGVVKNCLIVIASLAALATVFMVSTIILCAKLSARKYKTKKRQQGTEMMCISSLLPERNYNYTRQRNPVSNGVLVMHIHGDSDEDGEDNLTLSSFLPENDRAI